MGTIDDVRKVIQDFIAPELKALMSELKRIESESRVRDEVIVTKLDAVSAESRSRDEMLLAKLHAVAVESRSRDELILAKNDSIAAKMETIGAKLDFQYGSIINSLNLDKRVESLERNRHSPTA